MPVHMSAHTSIHMSLCQPLHMSDIAKDAPTPHTQFCTRSYTCLYARHRGIHTHTHACAHAYTHISTHAHTHACAHVYAHVSTRAFTHVRYRPRGAHVDTHVCAHVYAHVSARDSAHMISPRRYTRHIHMSMHMSLDTPSCMSDIAKEVIAVPVHCYEFDVTMGPVSSG